MTTRPAQEGAKAPSTFVALLIAALVGSAPVIAFALAGVGQ